MPTNEPGTEPSALAAARSLGVEVDKAGRARVTSQLNLPGHPENASERSPLRIVVLGLLAAAALALVAFGFRYLLVVFGGVLFALFLRACAGFLKRTLHVPYGVGLALLLTIGFGSTVAGCIAFAPTVAEQVETLQQELPQTLSALRKRAGRLPGVPQADKSEQRGNAGQSSGDLTKWLGPVASAIGGSIEVIGGLIVVFFIGVYGAAQPTTYRDAVLALTPKRYETKMRGALASMSSNLGRWLVGRVVAMLFVGITSTIGFHLLHVPLALALGVFAGALTFVEYAGAVISAIPPILFSLVASPTVALGVALLFTALHVVEGYLLTPLLARVAVRVPPAITLATQLLLGALAGPLGLTFSTPLLVACLSVAQSWRDRA